MRVMEKRMDGWIVRWMERVDGWEVRAFYRGGVKVLD